MEDSVINKEFIFEIIQRNKHTKRDAIVLLADFLVISKAEAKIIYEKEFKNNN